MEIKGNILEARLITGEEEEKYWNEEIIPQLKMSKAKYNNKNQRPKFQSQKKKNKRQRTISKKTPGYRKKTPRYKKRE